MCIRLMIGQHAVNTFLVSDFSLAVTFIMAISGHFKIVIVLLLLASCIVDAEVTYRCIRCWNKCRHGYCYIRGRCLRCSGHNVLLFLPQRKPKTDASTTTSTSPRPSTTESSTTTEAIIEDETTILPWLDQDFAYFHQENQLN